MYTCLIVPLRYMFCLPPSFRVGYNKGLANLSLPRFLSLSPSLSLSISLSLSFSLSLDVWAGKTIHYLPILNSGLHSHWHPSFSHSLVSPSHPAIFLSLSSSHPSLPLIQLSFSRFRDGTKTCSWHTQALCLEVK